MESAFREALNVGNGVFNCDDVMAYICNKHSDFKKAMDNLAPNLNERRTKVHQKFKNYCKQQKRLAVVDVVVTSATAGEGIASSSSSAAGAVASSSSSAARVEDTGSQSVTEKWTVEEETMLIDALNKYGDTWDRWKRIVEDPDFSLIAARGAYKIRDKFNGEVKKMRRKSDQALRSAERKQSREV